MNRRKNSLLITEQERKHILGLYGLINEATNSDTILTIEAKSTFKAGYYSELTPTGLEELQTGLANAQNWLIENKGSLIYVRIVAGESQLTNYDNEQNPPMPVEIGVLSEMRAKTLKRLLVPYFQELVDSGVIEKMPVFEPYKFEKGKTEFIKGTTVITPEKKKAYDSEQFVKVELKLMAPGGCIVGLTIEVKYDQNKNSSFPCRGGHKCNDAYFQMNLNGVKIGVADLNNGNDGGSRTSGEIKITDELAKQVAAVNEEKLVFSIKCLSSSNCHTGTPEIIIKKEGTSVYHSCSPSIKRGDNNEYELLTLDACGNVLEKGKGDATNKDVVPTETETKEATPGYDLYLFNADTWTDGSDMYKFLPYFYRVSPVDKNGAFSVSKGYDILAKTGFTGEIVVKEAGVTFDPGKILAGTDFAGTKGQGYSEYEGFALNIDPGTKINRVFLNKSQATNLPPGFAENPFIRCGETTGTGNYHVECSTDNSGYKYNLKLVKGPSSSYVKAQEKQKATEEQKKKEKEEKDKLAGYIKFTLDDDDTLDWFESYFKSYIKKRDDLGDGYYEIIQPSMTYAGKKYTKGQVITL
jgi:hypothetical protein